MGRKNKRMEPVQDKSFIKFMDSINKRNKYSNERKSNYTRYDKNEKLNYALEQFKRERIFYDVLDEEKGIVKVYHQSTGDEYIYYAFTKTLDGVKDLKGLNNVLEFLYT